MMNALRQLIESQQFRPGLIGFLVNPFYSARKGLWQHITALAGEIQGDVLDVGCGQKPYQELFRCESYVGLELDSSEARATSKADVFYNGKQFPFGDDEFNSVIVNQTFEHIFNPQEFLNEVLRVLKPGGKLLMTVPFIWDEHEQPHDFARYSSFGIRHSIEAAGFRVLEQRKSVCGVNALFQLVAACLYKSYSKKSLSVRMFFTLVLTPPLNLIGEVCVLALPGNEDFYLDNVLLAIKPNNE